MKPSIPECTSHEMRTGTWFKQFLPLTRYSCDNFHLEHFLERKNLNVELLRELTWIETVLINLHCFRKGLDSIEYALVCIQSLVYYGFAEEAITFKANFNSRPMSPSSVTRPQWVKTDTIQYASLGKNSCNQRAFRNKLYSKWRLFCSQHFKYVFLGETQKVCVLYFD